MNIYFGWILVGYIVHILNKYNMLVNKIEFEFIVQIIIKYNKRTLNNN